MKTIQAQLFKFHELSEVAQQVAIDNHREQSSQSEADGWHSSFNESKKAFLAVFGLGGRYGSLPSEVEDMKGVRLATYIWNNYASKLEEKRVTFLKCIGLPDNKKRESNIFVSRGCVLTGVIYDNYFADGIWDFLKKPCPHTTLEELIDSCVEDAEKQRQDDIENAYLDDSSVTHWLEAQDNDYWKDGEVAEISDYDEVA